MSMNLKIDNMNNKLYNILDDLSKYKHNKDDLFPMYVNERLNKSLQTYYKEITNSFNYLKYKDSNTILKRLNRY